MHLVFPRVDNGSIASLQPPERRASTRSEASLACSMERVHVVNHPTRTPRMARSLETAQERRRTLGHRPIFDSVPRISIGRRSSLHRLGDRSHRLNSSRKHRRSTASQGEPRSRSPSRGLESEPSMRRSHRFVFFPTTTTSFPLAFVDGAHENDGFGADLSLTFGRGFERQ